MNKHHKILCLFSHKPIQEFLTRRNPSLVDCWTGLAFRYNQPGIGNAVI